MTTVNDAAIRDKKKPKTVTVVFNRKNIEMPKGKTSGLEIKNSAIAAGIPIQVTYVLFLIKPNGRREVIGDGDIVNVREGVKFAAVADDDNS